MSILERLTEGVVNRNVAKEGAALLNKWSKTGLLEGLTGDHERQSMAVLLENQAKELLREANVQGGNPGGVQGFAAVAFPLVRRVFGGLLANDLVSVQPMSLPSGLIFFLDFTKTSERDNTVGDSVHGQGVVGSEIIDGVTLGEDGFYNLAQGYSSARGSCSIDMNAVDGEDAAVNVTTEIALDGNLSEANAQLVGFDADILADDSAEKLIRCQIDLATSAAVSSADCEVLPTKDLSAQMTAHHVMTLALSSDETKVGGDLAGAKLIRRLTKVTSRNAAGEVTGLEFFIKGVTKAALDATAPDFTFAIGDNISEVANGLGALNTKATWELESTLASPFGNDGMNIPEIDIKVDSTAITATTRKMKAKWSPELGQDLNAYHNLDAEVELTQVLSEQIALEIDQEILKDLITQAKAGTQYWSRVPGRFVSKSTGASDGGEGDFTGTVSEWYETLIETINDVSAQIHRKTLRGGANFLVCGPEVANILEFTNGFRASVTHDDDKGTVGAVKEGSINKKFDLYVDPYFPRNVILVGRKGGSFLESGYVYAPYVPLQTTPTIFGPEDFTPRKGVMTRYGKKMVRPDMYGLVVVRDMIDVGNLTA